MSWNAQRIADVARKSASVDYGAFEAIGLSEIENACVLDVGCFDGYNTVLKFAPYRNISHIVGIDPCADEIEQARNQTDDERFVWEVSDAEEYSGADESFDVAYFSHSFQHVRDKEQTLRNVFRLLKPGGYIVIKTIDDSLMISSPDPENVVQQVTSFYAENVRPFCAHTANTDRFNGKKCPTLLMNVGFDAVRLKVLYTDTLGKSVKERADLFERLTYFRRKVAPEAGSEVENHMHELLHKWELLFSDETYFFATPSVAALARKPRSPEEATRVDYKGPWFDVPQASDEHSFTGTLGPWHIRPMTEACLGDVMEIENVAFPNPWTPLAYALELRYNKDASYVVAYDEAGTLCGYLGIWRMAKTACITRVAVGPNARRKGLGRMLVQHACQEALEQGCNQMSLTVRDHNANARAFYRKLGFTECAKSIQYYSDPDEDGIIMAFALTQGIIEN